MNTRRLCCIAIATMGWLANLPAHAADGRTYAPGDFDSIDVSGSAVIRFVQGTSDEVFVEGDDELQNAVSVEVRGGRLSVHSRGSWKFWNARRLHMTVTARDLKRLSVSGAADLTASGPVQLERLRIDISGAGSARFDQLRAEQLYFQVSGAGDGTMTGTVKQLDVSISGKSQFHGENLMSERARVSISGIGGVEVWAQHELGISVAGVGTVDYWGAPSVRRSVSGHAVINERGAKRAAP
jgi:hypothetical protein